MSFSLIIESERLMTGIYAVSVSTESTELVVQFFCLIDDLPEIQVYICPRKSYWPKLATCDVTQPFSARPMQVRSKVKHSQRMTGA